MAVPPGGTAATGQNDIKNLKNTDLHFDFAFGKKYFECGFVCFLLMILLLGLAYLATVYWSTIFAISLAIMGFAVFLAGFVRQLYLFSNYTCKQCGQVLHSTTDHPSRKIVFPCAKCQINWEVNLYEPES